MGWGNMEARAHVQYRRRHLRSRARSDLPSGGGRPAADASEIRVVDSAAEAAVAVMIADTVDESTTRELRAMRKDGQPSTMRRWSPLEEEMPA